MNPRKKTYCLFLLSLWLIAPGSFCLAQHSFQNPFILDESNGLPSNNNTCIAKDHRGFLWIGTDEGLCRFDGSFVKVFRPDEKDTTSLPGGYIYDVLPDSSGGKIWVAAGENLAVYDPAQDKFKRYVHREGKGGSVPEFSPIRLFREKSGELWVSFRETGIARYRPETDDFIIFPVANFVRDVSEDWKNDSILWLGSETGLLKFNKFSGRHEQFFYRHKDRAIETNLNNIRCVYQHSDGKIFYGTWYGGVLVFDPEKERFSRFSSPCNQPAEYLNGVVYSIYPKSETELWLSYDKGLLLYDTKKDCVTLRLDNDLLRKKYYGVKLVDEQGRIWANSPQLGVYSYNPLLEQFQSLPYEDEEKNYLSLTRKILEDTLRKKLYVLAQGSAGLYVLDQQSGQRTVIPPPPGYQAPDGSTVFQGWDMEFLGNGELLIVEPKKLFLYKPGAAHLTLYHLQPRQDYARLSHILKDSRGYYWISGANCGLLRLDLSKNVLQSFEKELKEASTKDLNPSYAVEDKNSNIWFRETDGLLIYKRAENRFLYLPYEPGKERSFRGMANLEIGPDGRIWVATGHHGLAYAHPDSLDRGLLRRFTKSDGLKEDNVWLIKMASGKLWIFMETYLQEFDPVAMRFGQHYSLDYGLGQYDDDAIVLSSGALAVGKRKKIALFYPSALHNNQELPKPYVSSFRVFDKEWKLKNGHDRPDSVFLSYRQNFFSFEFSAIGYNLPAETRFLYQLEGFDEDWQDGTKRKFAAYTNVPGGNYLFKVRAVNSEGESLENPYLLYIHISTVWWKKWWFWLMVGLALLGSGYLVYRYKIKQVRKEEQLKREFEGKLADMEMSALRAQMNPHFIFNSLNSIEYYILNNEPEKASDYLNRFSRLIRLILQNSKSAFVPLKDDLEALRLYIEMESLRFNNLFDYEVKIEKGLDTENIEIPPMLLQPYVENAIWHGLMQKKEGKGKLDLSIRRENRHLCVGIEDNGIGREDARLLKSKSANQRKSFGMKITGDRLAMLNRITQANASVQIFDLKDDKGKSLGTRVELVIPV